MRLGSVIGPYPCLYWLDIDKKQLIVRQDCPGVAGEIIISITSEQQAELIEGLAPDPVRINRTKMSRLIREAGQVTTKKNIIEMKVTA